MEKSLNKDIQELGNALLVLKNETELVAFLRDVATPSELSAMAERLRVAAKVAEGMPYRQIVQEVGSSTATITRVAHWYHHGEGGYRTVIERLHRR